MSDRPSPGIDMMPRPEPTPRKPEASRITPAEIEQRKLNSDPIRKKLQEQGFSGDPKIKYSIDVLTGRNANGKDLVGQQSFTNYDDLQKFVKDNRAVIANKDLMDNAGIVPARIDYDQSVYDWSSNIPQGQRKELDGKYEKFLDETMDMKNFGKSAGERTPDETKRQVDRTAKQVLTDIKKQDVSQTIGSPDEIGQVVKEMANEATAEDPNSKFKARLAERDLQQADTNLRKFDFKSVDEVFSKFMQRNILEQTSATLRRRDISVAPQDRDRLLDISIASQRIRERPEGGKTQDLRKLEASLEETIAKYNAVKTEKPVKAARDEQKEQSQEGERKQENPLVASLNGRGVAEALNNPVGPYTEAKGVAAMGDVFKGLYENQGQLGQRLGGMVDAYQNAVISSVTTSTDKPSQAHRAFANKQVIAGLSSDERAAVESYLDKNYQKLGGKGQRMIGIELPFSDFLYHLEKNKT